ncbi:MAG TPA: hypothetical protein VJA94_05730 [Candidatus Angelobacter sp.]
MADRIQRARIEDPGWQGDTSVWSAIRYLDSPTDYRECLPRAEDAASVPESDLIFLDNMPRGVRMSLQAITLIAIVVCLVLLLLLRS